jgi:FkbM family methyltransferase
MLGPLGARKRAELMNRLFNPAWEPSVTKRVKRLEGQIFVDCGANLGYYSFIAARRFRVVYAMEPEPNNIVQLKRGIDRAGFKNIHVVEAAIADNEGYTLLSHSALPNPHPGHWTIEKEYVFTPTRHKRVQIPTNQSITVPVHTLPNVLPNEIIDVVKVDVEGAEWRILKGAESIMPRIRTWIIELHDLTRKRELVEYMSNHGYECDWLDEHHGLFSLKLPAAQ